MNSQPVNKLSAWIIILALLLGWILWAQFNRRESQLRDEQITLLANLPTPWAKEDAEHALAARQKSLEMEKAYAQEAIKRLGGPLAAAVKDPTLDIQQMLTQIAIASAPRDAEVSVTVDRFTEFDAAIVLHQALSLRQMAEMAKAILKNSVPYVHSLRFIQGNEVLAQLQESAIESVPNWNAASVDSIQDLLSAPETEFAPGAAGDGTATQPPVHDLSPDQTKMDRARSIFKTHFDQHAVVLQKLVADLSQAAQLDSIQNRNQLEAQIASLDGMASRLATERDFFLHQSADMEELLKSQQLDSLTIIIMKRDMERSSQDEAVILSRAFNSVSAYQEQIKNFLSTMENHWGEWTPVPATRQIQFATASARNDYSRDMISLQQSVQTVQNNFRSWANDKSAK